MLRVSSRSARPLCAASSHQAQASQGLFQARRGVGNTSSSGQRGASDRSSGDKNGYERKVEVRGYRHWLVTEGRKWKNPARPRNWLGGDVPFPMNTTFKPPTPLSDSLRKSIWLMHKADPVGNDARTLASQFGLSIKRVEAIIKLKATETEWHKQKPLQTGFVKGMEFLLGITDDGRTARAAVAAAAAQAAQLSQPLDKPLWPEVTASSRQDTQAADIQVENEGEQGLRDRGRYRRMYWESVGDGEEIVVPEQVQKTRDEAKQRRENLKVIKSDPVLLTGLSVPRLRATGRKRTVVVDREGRPGIKFVDVGGKFIDVQRATKKVREVE